MATTISPSLRQIPLRHIDGTPTTLAAYRDQVLLIVNVASECGLTPQYEALERLYARYREQGLVVLGFPCNDFGAQEPGSHDEIAQFCQVPFGVHFPMFEKLSVRGEGAHPLYRHLINAFPIAEDHGDRSFAEKLASYGFGLDQPHEVLWNFEKFLVDRHGIAVGRFRPHVTPDDPAFVAAVEAALRAP